jgi:hypothetical protein
MTQDREEKKEEAGSTCIAEGLDPTWWHQQGQPTKTTDKAAQRQGKARHRCGMS